MLPMPSPRGWSYFATKLNGDGTESELAVDIPFTSPTFTGELSAPDTFTATIDPEIQSLKNSLGTPLFIPWSTAIYVSKDGLVRYGFIVASVTPESNHLAITGKGFTWYPEGMPWTNSPKKFYDTDPAAIIRIIWQYIQMHPKGNLGMTLTPLTTAVKVGAKIAEVKNSKGEVTTEPQDEPILLANYSTHDLGALLEELMATGHIDYTERHTLQPNGTMTHEMVLAHPRLGQRRTDIRFVLGENVLPIPSMDMDYSDYASEVLVLGAGEGDKKIRGHAYNPAADRLRRVAVQIAPHIGQTATALRSAASRAKSLNADGLTLTELTVYGHPNAPLFSWGIGDEVRVTGAGGWAGEVDLWVRILSSTYSPSNHEDSATLRVTSAERT